MDKDIISACEDLAKRHGIPVHHLLAFIETESSGKAFWPVGKELRPAIRIEGHYFYRLLQGDERDEAIRLGLAAKKAGVIKNPANQSARYEMLARMEAINSPMALRSISIGLGQVMIEHFKRLDFKTPGEMFLDAHISVYNQVAQMVKFITTDARLYTAVKIGDWPTAATIYNGPAHKNYDVTMKNAAERWRTRWASGAVAGKSVEPAPNLALERIKALGHDSVKSFQKQYGLRVDGLIGPITLEKLDEVEAQIKGQVNAKRNSALKFAGTAIGGSITVAAGNESGFSLETVSSYVDMAQRFAGVDWRIIAGVVGAVGVVALGKAGWEWWKNRDVQ